MSSSDFSQLDHAQYDRHGVVARRARQHDVAKQYKVYVRTMTVDGMQQECDVTVKIPRFLMPILTTDCLCPDPSYLTMPQGDAT